MEIKKLSANARVGEVSDVAKSILNAFETSSITDDTTMQLIIGELQESNNALVFAIEKENTISKLEEYDEVRDKSFQSLYHYLKGTSYTPDATVANAAGELFAVMERYGYGIANLAYGEESTQLNSMLLDFQDAAKVELILKVPQASSMVGNLNVAQQEFETYYNNYLEQLSQRKAEQSASSIKPETLSIINNRLVKYLNAQVEFNPDTYGNYSQVVDIAIDRTNENIKERNKKSESEE